MQYSSVALWTLSSSFLSEHVINVVQNDARIIMLVAMCATDRASSVVVGAEGYCLGVEHDLWLSVIQQVRCMYNQIKQ